MDEWFKEARLNTILMEFFNSTQGEITMIEIGALWKQTSAKGQEYYSGKIDFDKLTKQTDKLVMFLNENKSNEKAPDAKIYQKEFNQVKKQDELGKHSQHPVQNVQPGVDTLDIPF